MRRNVLRVGVQKHQDFVIQDTAAHVSRRSILSMYIGLLR
jgi:hypothetical protein